MIQSYIVYFAFTWKPVIGIPVLLIALAGIWYFFDHVKRINKAAEAAEAAMAEGK